MMQAVRIARLILAGAAAAACLPAFASDAKADWCKQLVPRLPGVSLADCQSSGLAPTGAVSRKGVPILMRSVPADLADKKAVPMRVLLLGGIHGDELTSSSIVFQWMRWLQGPQARQMHWKVVPVMNPDGMLASKPQRVNANGVDLNRNFPTPGWERDAKHYWTRTTGSDPRRFPGHEPLSEPETRWLNEEMERFQPDVIISVHAPFGVLDLDGPAKAPRRFGRLHYSRVGVYPGSLGNYGGIHKNVPVITIELPHALDMPSQDEVRRIWVDMINWIVGSVPKRADGAPASSLVRTTTRAALADH